MPFIALEEAQCSATMALGFIELHEPLRINELDQSAVCHVHCSSGSTGVGAEIFGVAPEQAYFLKPPLIQPILSERSCWQYVSEDSHRPLAARRKQPKPTSLLAQAAAPEIEPISA